MESEIALGFRTNRRKSSEFSKRFLHAMTDEQILERLRDGGPRQTAALRELYRVKGRAFGRYFLSQGIFGNDVEDLLQVVVLRILKEASSVRDLALASSWMWQVARNCLIDEQRKRTARPEQLLTENEWEIEMDHSDFLRDSGEADPERLVQDCVAKGLEKFAEQQPERAFVLELVVEGLDQHEIAARVGRSYAAIRTFICECRKKLKPYVQHCLEHLPTQGATNER